MDRLSLKTNSALPEGGVGGSTYKSFTNLLSFPGTEQTSRNKMLITSFIHLPGSGLFRANPHSTKMRVGISKL